MPQGLSLSVSLPVALAAFIALGSQRTLRLFTLVVGALGRLMSRGDELRQLAAQLSVLAALGDSIAACCFSSQARLWFLQLRQRPQRLLQRPRPVVRWRPLCCAPRLFGHPLPGRALALALLRRCPNVLHGHRVAAPVLLPVCVALMPSRSRDWSRAWPPRLAHHSRLTSCASHALLALFVLP